MIVSIMSQGTMGAGTAARLTANGVTVRTMLAGRSAASHERARKAGMEDATPEDFAAADVILSILPPGEAIAFAREIAPAIRETGQSPLYVDFNAVNVETAESVAANASAAGARFVDGGIIGGPPREGYDGPVFYVSGPEAGAAADALVPAGLRIVTLDGPVGMASALKMSYAGITKGLTALAATMILAASRGGVGEALHAELASSQPDLLATFSRSLPGMLPKAYRWIAEMEEIANFIGPDRPEHRAYLAIADLYRGIAADVDGEGREAQMLTAFFDTSA